MEQNKIYKRFFTTLKKSLVILQYKKEENVHNTLTALWQTAAGNPVSPITAEKLALPSLSLSQISTLETLVQSRLSGTPLAHLTGRQNFMGLDYIVNKGNYIPRRDTELLAETSIKTISDKYSLEKKISVIDLCTGIGTVAIAIAYHCKNTYAYGADINKSEIDTAKINAKRFLLDQKTSFLVGNMFDPFVLLSLKNKVHVIVSAPPYISTTKVKTLNSEVLNHEPKEAFDAGPFGLSIFLIILDTAHEYLTTNGYLIIECGSGQGEFIADRIETNDRYGEVEKICDKSGEIRVLKAKKVR